MFLWFELLAANVFWGFVKTSWRFVAQNKSGSRLHSIDQILCYLSQLTAKETTCNLQEPSEKKSSSYLQPSETIWKKMIELLKLISKQTCQNSDRVSGDATTEEPRLSETKQESQYNTDLWCIQDTDKYFPTVNRTQKNINIKDSHKYLLINVKSWQEQCHNN